MRCEFGQFELVWGESGDHMILSRPSSYRSRVPGGSSMNAAGTWTCTDSLRMRGRLGVGAGGGGGGGGGGPAGAAGESNLPGGGWQMGEISEIPASTSRSGSAGKRSNTPLYTRSASGRYMPMPMSMSAADARYPT